MKLTLPDLEGLRRAPHRAGSYVDAVIEAWLGYSSRPAEEIITDADFEIDTFDRYCARCGASVGLGEATGTGCASCRGTRPPYVRVIRLGAYEPPLSEWITALKYERRSEFGRVLGMFLANQIRASRLAGESPAIVTPVPMPWQRRMYRGIDHANVLASAVARELGIPVRPMLRKINTDPQVTRAASERRRSRPKWILPAKRRWRRGERKPLKGLDVILIDDVRTTGATARVCGRVLRELGASRVILAVAAVVDEPARRSPGAQSGQGDQGGQ